MPKHLSDDALDYFRAHGARGGKIGGKRAAANMTAAERKARATKASRAAALVRTAKRKAAIDAAAAQLTDLEHKRQAHAARAKTQATAKKAKG